MNRCIRRWYERVAFRLRGRRSRVAHGRSYWAGGSAEEEDAM